MAVPIVDGSYRLCQSLFPKTVELFVACDYMFERPSNCAVCNNC